jgi:hypothetical protein
MRTLGRKGEDKPEKEKKESRTELVNRLQSEDLNETHYWGSFHRGPILRGVTNSKGVLEKGGLSPDTLYYILLPANWKGEPVPVED